MENQAFKDYELNKPILDLGCGFNDSGACVKLDYVTQVGTVGPTVANILGDAHNMPFKDESFNSVYSTQAFEHFYDIEKVIEECYRILKSKGRILVDVPFDLGILDEDLNDINKEILENEGALRYYQEQNWVSYRFDKPIVDIHVRTCTEDIVNSWFVEELWDLLIIKGGTFVYEKI